MRLWSGRNIIGRLNATFKGKVWDYDADEDHAEGRAAFERRGMRLWSGLNIRGRLNATFKGKAWDYDADEDGAEGRAAFKQSSRSDMVAPTAVSHRQGMAFRRLQSIPQFNAADAQTSEADSEFGEEARQVASGRTSEKRDGFGHGQFARFGEVRHRLRLLGRVAFH